MFSTDYCQESLGFVLSEDARSIWTLNVTPRAKTKVFSSVLLNCGLKRDQLTD